MNPAPRGSTRLQSPPAVAREFFRACLTNVYTARMADARKTPDAHGELKGWLADCLGFRPGAAAFEVLWGYLAKHRYVSEALDPNYRDYGRAELLAAAKEQLELARDLVQLSSAVVRPSQHAGEGAEVELVGRDSVVNEALSNYLAAHVARRPEVRAFRAGLPGRRPLTSDREVREFLVRQPQVQEALVEKGAQVDVSSTPLPELAQLVVRGVRARPRPVESVGEPDLTVGDRASLQVGQLAAWLSELYPFEPADLVLLVLAGRRPLASNPVQVSVAPAHGAANIRFMPWVSAEAVHRAYYELQRRLLSWNADKPFEDKPFRAFQFVVGKSDEHGNRPPYSEMLRLWNEANPDEKFEHESSLRRAFKRVAKKVAGPWP